MHLQTSYKGALCLFPGRGALQWFLPGESPALIMILCHLISQNKSIPITCSTTHGFLSGNVIPQSYLPLCGNLPLASSRARSTDPSGCPAAAPAPLNHLNAQRRPRPSRHRAQPPAAPHGDRETAAPWPLLPGPPHSRHASLIARPQPPPGLIARGQEHSACAPDLPPASGRPAPGTAVVACRGPEPARPRAARAGPGRGGAEQRGAAPRPAPTGPSPAPPQPTAPPRAGALLPRMQHPSEKRLSPPAPPPRGALGRRRDGGIPAAGPPRVMPAVTAAGGWAAGASPAAAA